MGNLSIVTKRGSKKNRIANGQKGRRHDGRLYYYEVTGNFHRSIQRFLSRRLLSLMGSITASPRL